MTSAAPIQMPRWEWRTFAPFDGELRKVHSGSTGLQMADSHEVRILCLHSMHDVLIRGGALRLKWRKQVGPGGLERWDPVLQAVFPCPSDLLLRLFGAWGLPAPRLTRALYSQEQFLDEVVRQHPELCIVEIRTRSEVFLLDGARCEWTDLAANQVRVESFSIEHEDPGLTLQVIGRLGLQAHANICYPQGLKSALHIHSQP